MRETGKPWKVLLVVGTRPEVVKMAPVYKVLKEDHRFAVSLFATGQHVELLDKALSDFQIFPDHSINLMLHNQSLTSLTARALLGIEKTFTDVKPEAVLVHGDTLTTLAGAMCCFYGQIPFGHVEAGLRTRDLSAPFPEEFNRQVVSRIATWNFAPNQSAIQNLLREDVSESSIVETGNTIVDALLLQLGAEKNSNHGIEIEELRELLGFNPEDRQFVLITAHRRENISNGMESIFLAISRLAREFLDTHFVLPLHPNPKISEIAKTHLMGLGNVRVISPLNYAHFIFLLSRCRVAITDSGGIQEEAVSLGVPVIVVRESTERPEGLSTGLMQIAGLNPNRIVEAAKPHMIGVLRKRRGQTISNVYGDGLASQRIRDTLADHFLALENLNKS